MAKCKPCRDIKKEFEEEYKKVEYDMDEDIHSDSKYFVGLENGDAKFNFPKSRIEELKSTIVVLDQEVDDQRLLDELHEHVADYIMQTGEPHMNHATTLYIHYIDGNTIVEATGEYYNGMPWRLKGIVSPADVLDSYILTAWDIENIV